MALETILEIRKEKYKYLREHGFTADEATALKGKSWVNIKKLAALNMEFIRQRDEIMKERENVLKIGVTNDEK